MLRVHDPGLSEATLRHLETQQAAIDVHLTHQGRKDEMEHRWGAKHEGDGKVAFDEIHRKLHDMAVGQKYCNYCEHNLILQSTIEHIRPKGTFPNHAFVWRNMLGVCENCNMGFKKAQMWVFWPVGSSEIFNVGYSEPKSDDLAFVDPRSELEDPLNLMELDFEDFQFKPNRVFSQTSREFQKVQKTISILHLFEDDLAATRACAFDDFISRLDDYCKVLSSVSLDELKWAIKVPLIDQGRDLEDEKKRILNHIKRQTLGRNHQTVLREIVRRVDELPEAIRQVIVNSKAAEWI